MEEKYDTESGEIEARREVQAYLVNRLQAVEERSGRAEIRTACAGLRAELFRDMGAVNVEVMRPSSCGAGEASRG